MSTLSSSSTEAQVKAAMADNASYLEDASAAKCASYITALQIRIGQLVEKKKVGEGGADIERDIMYLEKLLDRAHTWLSENSTSLLTTNRSSFTRGIPT